MIEWLRPSSAKRFAFFLFFDIILSLCTLYAAYLLRFNFNIPSEFLPPFFSVAFTLITLKIFWIHKFKNYTIVWRFYALTEAKNLFFALIIAYGMLALIHTLLPNLFYPFPRSVIIIDLFLSFVFLGGLRLIKRLMFGFGLHYNDLKRTLFIGISPNTANLIKSALEGSREYYPVGIIAVQEKNYNMIGSYLNNIKISGMEEVHNLVESKNITAAIIDGSLSNEYLREAYQRLSDAGIREIKRTRLLDESVNKIEELSIEELLARHPKDLDTHTIETFIHGKTVLITGAGGKIGRASCRERV